MVGWSVAARLDRDEHCLLCICCLQLHERLVVEAYAMGCCAQELYVEFAISSPLHPSPQVQTTRIQRAAYFDVCRLLQGTQILASCQELAKVMVSCYLSLLRVSSGVRGSRVSTVAI